MKKILILVLICINVLGGDEVGNGAGYRENLATHIFMSIGKIIEEVISQDTSSDYCNSLSKILEIMPTVHEESRLIFTEEDGNFFIDGEYRFAYTSNISGANIFINLKKLYEVKIEDLYRTVVSILIHELGHQVGILDHYYLDKLGNFAHLNGIKSHRRVYSNIFIDDNIIEITSYLSPEKSDEVMLITAQETEDISTYFFEEMKCRGKFEILDMSFNSSEKGFIGTMFVDCVDGRKYFQKFFLAGLLHSFMERFRFDLPVWYKLHDEKLAQNYFYL